MFGNSTRTRRSGSSSGGSPKRTGDVVEKGNRDVDFQGFTHISGKNRLGRFMVRGKTIRKRSEPSCDRFSSSFGCGYSICAQTGRWLKSVVHGHFHRGARGTSRVWGRCGTGGLRCGRALFATAARNIGLRGRAPRASSAMASSTAYAPSFFRCALRRHLSAIRTGCAEERLSGCLGGIARVVSLP